MIQAERARQLRLHGLRRAESSVQRTASLIRRHRTREFRERVGDTRARSDEESGLARTVSRSGRGPR